MGSRKGSLCSGCHQGAPAVAISAVSHSYLAAEHCGSESFSPEVSRFLATLVASLWCLVPEPHSTGLAAVLLLLRPLAPGGSPSLISVWEVQRWLQRTSGVTWLEKLRWRRSPRVDPFLFVLSILLCTSPWAAPGPGLMSPLTPFASILHSRSVVLSVLAVQRIQVGKDRFWSSLTVLMGDLRG